MEKGLMGDFLGANYILFLDLDAGCIQFVKIYRAVYLGYVHFSVCLCQ